MIFADRREAGQHLAAELKRFSNEPSVVLALPRGGIVLGAEVAKALKAPLGLVLVRKIGHPSYPEYAIGAVAEDEPPVYNEREASAIDQAWLSDAEAQAQSLIKQRREMYYGSDFRPPEVAGKTAIIVDDGIATGLTMQAAIRAVRGKEAEKVVVAVPVASVESIDELKPITDEIIVLDRPENFLGAVAAHYQEFEQVNDQEVRMLLREVNNEVHKATAAGATSAKSS